jgi:hypothetical protein
MSITLDFTSGTSGRQTFRIGAMGLDTYAGRVPVDVFDPDLDETKVDYRFGCTTLDLLALRRAERRRERQGGCLFSGNYFRGGIYALLISHVTGVFIERGWIPPETVAEMSEAFQRCDPEATIRDYEASGGRAGYYQPSDLADLQAFFKVCANRGLGLVGSW